MCLDDDCEHDDDNENAKSRFFGSSLGYNVSSDYPSRSFTFNYPSFLKSLYLKEMMTSIQQWIQQQFLASTAHTHIHSGPSLSETEDTGMSTSQEDSMANLTTTDTLELSSNIDMQKLRDSVTIMEMIFSLLKRHSKSLNLLSINDNVCFSLLPILTKRINYDLLARLTILKIDVAYAVFETFAWLTQCKFENLQEIYLSIERIDNMAYTSERNQSRDLKKITEFLKLHNNITTFSLHTGPGYFSGVDRINVIISQNAKTLKNVRFRGCRFYKSCIFDALAHCSRLVKISFRDCSMLDSKQVEKFVSAQFEYLREVYVSGEDTCEALFEWSERI
ncbi:2344_t:CDS:2 [Ambispora leptoticha]|uniref:2344_t:CDS:1 n=1 Tax=Ambispora leptoticha TaxID=144679 RepID=A0A9N9GI14_9GLOM|nr:2344_t:CDS:2 [Ambispora leptoticha]